MSTRKPDIWNCSKAEWEAWEKSPEGAAEMSVYMRKQKNMENKKHQQFLVGDQVFHEMDAKKPHMLMHIDEIEPNGMIWATYIDKKFNGRRWHGYESEIVSRSDAL